MVSIRDSASRDPSSNLGRTQIFLTCYLVFFHPQLLFSLFSNVNAYYFFRHIFIDFFFCRCRGLPNPKYYCSRECQGEIFFTIDCYIEVYRWDTTTEVSSYDFRVLLI